MTIDLLINLAIYSILTIMMLVIFLPLAHQTYREVKYTAYIEDVMRGLREYYTIMLITDPCDGVIADLITLQAGGYIDTSQNTPDFSLNTVELEFAPRRLARAHFLVTGDEQWASLPHFESINGNVLTVSMSMQGAVEPSNWMHLNTDGCLETVPTGV